VVLSIDAIAAPLSFVSRATCEIFKGYLRNLQGAHPMIRQSRGDEDLDLLVLFMISFVVIGSEFAE
jgi:hypothetical protein